MDLGLEGVPLLLVLLPLCLRLVYFFLEMFVIKEGARPVLGDVAVVVGIVFRTNVDSVSRRRHLFSTMVSCCSLPPRPRRWES